MKHSTFVRRLTIAATLVAVGACQDVTSTKPPAPEPRPAAASAVSKAVGAATGAVVYHYTGNPFTLFSCGASDASGACATPAPANTFTSYTATDHITATLTLDAPLPANAQFLDLKTLPGFQLSLSDGHQTLTQADSSDGISVDVSTDANGNIIGWYLGVGANGHQILTTSETFDVDQAILECCDPAQHANLAYNQNPGTWTVAASTPAQAITDLLGVVADPGTGLRRGQVKRLTNILDKALADAQAGKSTQAKKELQAFIKAVQNALRAGRISAQTAAMLIAAANAIIATL